MGFQGLKRLAGLIYFSAFDKQGHNPNWMWLDYAAPESLAASEPAPIQPLAIMRRYHPGS